MQSTSGLVLCESRIGRVFQGSFSFAPPTCFQG